MWVGGGGGGLSVATGHSGMDSDGDLQARRELSALGLELHRTLHRKANERSKAAPTDWPTEGTKPLVLFLTASLGPVPMQYSQYPQACVCARQNRVPLRRWDCGTMENAERPMTAARPTMRHFGRTLGTHAAAWELRGRYLLGSCQLRSELPAFARQTQSHRIVLGGRSSTRWSALKQREDPYARRWRCHQPSVTAVTTCLQSCSPP